MPWDWSITIYLVWIALSYGLVKGTVLSRFASNCPEHTWSVFDECATLFCASSIIFALIVLVSELLCGNPIRFRFLRIPKEKK
jgi:formate-dependent nitrite reductase membrane component NrfD